MSRPENLHQLVAAALQASIDNGQAQLPIDESGRNILRRWAGAKQRGHATRAQSVVNQPAVKRQQPEPQTSPSAAENGVHGTDSAEGTNPLKQQEHAGEATADSAASVAASKVADKKRPSAATHSASLDAVLRTLADVQINAALDKQQQLGQLWQQLAAWRSALAEPAAYGKVALWGRGDLQAKVMFVGEYPTVSDELNGVYISERAGAKFDAILRAMGLEREQIWLTGLLKYTPLQADNSSSLGRSVELQEFAAFAHLLKLEVEIIRPQVIVALGDSVFSVLGGDCLQQANGIKSCDFAGCKVVGSYSPSHIVMYDHDVSEKRKFWVDMLEVMRLADMPVSARQANYFVQK